jgi:hypothetical protein
MPDAALPSRSYCRRRDTLRLKKLRCLTGAPSRQSFGTRLIGSLGQQLKAQVQLAYESTGQPKYYNEMRTHLSMEKDAPVPRVVERAGHILCRPVLGGLHHQYVRT